MGCGVGLVSGRVLDLFWGESVVAAGSPPAHIPLSTAQPHPKQVQHTIKDKPRVGTFMFNNFKWDGELYLSLVESWTYFGWGTFYIGQFQMGWGVGLVCGGVLVVQGNLSKRSFLF